MPFWADLHAHTINSGHAFSTLDEMAAAAAAEGIDMLGITEHGPAMTGAPHAGFFDMSGRVPETLRGVRILAGIEANILDERGTIDLEPELLVQQRLVLAGLHARTPYPTDTSPLGNTYAKWERWRTVGRR